MPPKSIQRQPQDVTPATLSAIRPGTPVVPLNPQEEAALSEVARKQGVNTAEALRRVAESLPTEPQKQTVTEQSLDKLERARELGLTSDDKTDPLNQVMRYGFYKDLKKDMKRGDEERMSTREMMEMNMVNMQLLIMQKSMGDNQGGGATQHQILNDMRAENEKQRQYYEQKLKEQDEKIRDMLFEKRIRTMEDNQAETVNNLSQQLADISQRMELYRNIPTNPSPEEKKDAISHLEDFGKELGRVRKALEPFGIIPSTQSPASSVPGVPGQDAYKKQDGSMDYFRYTVDKLESTIGKVTDAWQKKTPDRKQVAETPPPAETHQTHQTEATYRQLSPEEYADVLLSKANPTQEEQQWLNNYTAYLEKQRVKLQPKTKVQQYTRQTAPERQAAGEPQLATGCRICGSPEIYHDGFCEQCWNNQNITPEPAVDQQPKKSVIDRLREQEDEELRRSGGLL